MKKTHNTNKHSHNTMYLKLPFCAKGGRKQRSFNSFTLKWPVDLTTLNTLWNNFIFDNSVYNTHSDKSEIREKHTPLHTKQRVEIYVYMLVIFLNLHQYLYSVFLLKTIPFIVINTTVKQTIYRKTS